MEWKLYGSMGCGPANCYKALWKSRHARSRYGRAGQLVDALESFGKSRATKRLIRHGEENNIRCVLRVPLLRDCRVRSDELGRALREAWRASIGVAEPGDRFVIDLYVGADSRLVVRAARA